MMVGRGDVFMVGGTENMSLVPLLFNAAAAKKFGALARAKSFKDKFAVMSSFRPDDFKPRIGLQMGLSDPVSGLNMGQTAENVARDFNITREDQDQFALQSHLKAVAAKDKLKAEITPVYLPRSATARRISTRITARAKVRPSRRWQSCGRCLKKSVVR